VRGIQDGRIEVEDLFVFERLGMNDKGKVRGRFRAASQTPKVLERLKIYGVEMPASVFSEVVDVNP
jgi:pilus assembly protein CpaF